MAEAGVNVQRFQMAGSREAGTAAGTLLMNSVAKELVIKAQILAGGRGKGIFDSGFKGGVHLTKVPETAGELVGEMVGRTLVTKQTGPGGVKVQQVMVAEALDIARETYLAIVMDREHNGPVMIGSPMGGMDIEEVAASSPEAIKTDPIDIMTGVTDDQAKAMAEFLQFKGDLVTEAAGQIKSLYGLLGTVDATLLEVSLMYRRDTYLLAVMWKLEAEAAIFHGSGSGSGKCEMNGSGSGSGSSKKILEAEVEAEAVKNSLLPHHCLKHN